MELKAPSVNLKEADFQIQGYSNSFQKLLNYIEILVISNKVDTEYYANQSKSENHSLSNLRFTWANSENKIINKFSTFVKEFLTPCRLAQIISRYIILHEEKQRLLIMCPHQIHALENLITRATTTGNNGGYVWHTTGSGKTLTAFAFCRALNNVGNSQVFFVTDRKELDHQTFEEFNSFQKDIVTKMDNTEELVKNIKQDSNKIISISINKLNIAVKNSKNKELILKLQDKKVYFIIDECHRTQSGNMHATLKNTFPNAQFFGFTGTPLKEENTPPGGKTTQNLFEKCLHFYAMDDALKDDCVLKFYVQFPSQKVKEIKDAHSNKRKNALLLNGF
ncbi:MAG: DEAD/DEAH box helicase family protein [Candidatus Phytoplasma sp. TWB_XP]